MFEWLMTTFVRMNEDLKQHMCYNKLYCVLTHNVPTILGSMLIRLEGSIRSLKGKEIKSSL